MARLPSNVDRMPDNGGYRYVAYAKDGFCCHLRYNGSAWEARAVLTGAYIGSRRTLELIGKLVASYQVRETYAQALARRTANLSAWNPTDDERRNVIRARRNGYGVRLTFADNSAAFIAKGTAKVEVRA